MEGKPRIVHLWIKESAPAVTYLSKVLELAENHIDFLLRIGAVYARKKRASIETFLEQGDYVRVHLDPRRFPAHAVDWKATLVHETQDFAIVDKPAGIPVQPTLDNAVENVAHQLGMHLGQMLFVTHRLDIPTRGLVVLAKTKAFQTQFNEALLKRRVLKQYRATVDTPPPLGPLIHFMKPESGAPKTVSSVPKEGWLSCELRVQDVSQRPDGQYEATIDLITGRTHQIRCQLAAIGCPISGDEMYGKTKGVLGLRSSFLSFSYGSNKTPLEFRLA